ncbi:MAG: hypothetical protein AABX19_00695 [Nanoarchaeota archaeon]
MQHEVRLYVLEKNNVINGDRRYKHIFGFYDGECEKLLEAGNFDGYKVVYRNRTTSQRSLFAIVKEAVDVSNTKGILDTEVLDYILGNENTEEMLVGTIVKLDELKDSTVAYYNLGDTNATL